MGTSTDGILTYGYDLGGSDDLKIREVDEYGGPVLPWLPDDSDDLPGAFFDQILAQVAGFTETWDTRIDDDYFGRRSTAEKSTGMEIVTYCSVDAPMFVLATYEIRVGRGHVKHIDPAFLAAEPSRQGWDDRLRHALDVIQITPTQEQPGWLLVSDWG